MDNWNPMRDDFNSTNFNSYDRGPGKNLPLEHLPPYKSKQNKPAPSVNLYVTGIPASLKQEGLENIFSEYGKVTRCFVAESNKVSDGSHYGFIDFTKINEAEAAIYALDNQPPYKMRVQFSLSADDRRKAVSARQEEKDNLQQLFQKEASFKDRFNSRNEPNIKIQVTGNQKSVTCVNNPIAPQHMSEGETSISVNGIVDKPSENKLIEHFIATGPSQNLSNRPSSNRNDVEMRRSDYGVIESRIISSSEEYQSSIVTSQPERLPCNFCKRPGGFRCQRCKAWYCGQTCQLNDWPEHKKTCIFKLERESGSFMPVPSTAKLRSIQDKPNQAVLEPSSVLNNNHTNVLKIKDESVTSAPEKHRSSSSESKPFDRGSDSLHCNQKGYSFNKNNSGQQTKSFNNSDNFRSSARTENLSQLQKSNERIHPDITISENKASKPTSQCLVEKIEAQGNNQVRERTNVKASHKYGPPDTSDTRNEGGKGRSSSRNVPSNASGELRRPLRRLEAENQPHPPTQVLRSTFEFLSENPCKVRVCFLSSPNEFYVQKVSDADAMSNLTTELHQYALCEESLNVPLLPGDFCIALYDDVFYRAQVIKVQPDKSHEVLFVDYGNKDTVQLKNIRLLPEKFRVLPAQTLKCCLAKVAPLENEWERLAIESLSTLVADLDLRCKFIMEYKGVAMVELFDEKGHNISIEMVKINCAKEAALPGASISLTNTKTPPVPLQETKTPTTIQPTSTKSTPCFIEKKQEKEASRTNSPTLAKIGAVKPPLPSILSSLHVKSDPLSATVTWVVDELHFWATIYDDDAIIQKVAEASRILGETHEKNSTNFLPTVGQVVCAKSGEDGECYRAYVKEKCKGNTYKVHFIDFGNEEVVSSVSPLATEFRSFACPAILLISDKPLQIECNENLFLRMASVSASFVTFSLLDNEGHERTQLIGRPWYSGLLEETDSGVSSPIPVASMQESLPMYEAMISRETSSPFQANGVWYQSPKEIYLQNIVDVPKLEDLMKKITDVASIGCTNKIVPIVNQIVLALDSDGVWYRARVVGISEQMALVHYIDYGNQADTKLGDLQACPIELAQEAPFALFCTLGDVEELDQEQILLLVSECVWTVVVKNAKEGKMNVVLSGPQGPFLKSGQHAENVMLGSSPKEMVPDSAVATSRQPPQTRCEEAQNNLMVAADSESFYEGCFSNEPYIDLPIGQKISCTVSAVESPELIYINYYPDQVMEQKFTELSTDIEVYCISHPVDPSYSPKLENICLAQFDLDKMWYRAAVLGVEDKTLTVIFVDYGNIEITNHFMPIPSKFMVLPFQAAQCCLHGIKLETAWQDEVSKGLRKFLLESPIVEAVITSKEEDCSYCIHIPTARDHMLQAGLLQSDPNSTLPNLTADLSLAHTSTREVISNESATSASSQPSHSKCQELENNSVLSTNSSECFYEGLFSNQKYIDLPTGQKIGCTVSSVSSPDLIYINYFSNDAESQKFLDLSVAINQYCASPSLNQTYSPKLGGFCLAQFDEDNSWYRAVILSIADSNGNIKVIFVDYGNQGTTKQEQVRPIPSKFMELPLQAVQCRLYGIIFKNCWPDNVCEELRTFLMSNPSVEVVATQKEEEFYVHIPTARDHMLIAGLLQPDPKAVLPNTAAQLLQPENNASELVQPAPIATLQNVPAQSPEEMLLLQQQIQQLQEQLQGMVAKLQNK